MSANSNLDILKNETIKYNNSIIISIKKLEEVYFYSRDINTSKDYKLISIKLNIPLVAINEKKKYARILLYFDDQMIYDGTIWSQVEWEMKPLNLEGIVTDIKKGEHKLKLKCCVSGGKLYIPYYDTTSILYSIKPELSGKLIVIGQN